MALLLVRFPFYTAAARGQSLVCREEPLQMGGVGRGEVSREEVEEAWWLENPGGRM